jgi:hypothetical protein
MGGFERIPFAKTISFLSDFPVGELKMVISKGIYDVLDHRVRFSLPEDIQFTAEHNCIWLTGENGVGKTTFIEGVLMPALLSERIPFLYFGQDFQTQYYTIQALLAVEGKTIDPSNFEGTIGLWLERGRDADILILDEFDKYWKDINGLYQLTRNFIRTYLWVTHTGNPKDHGPGEPFKYRRWNFTAKDAGSPVPHVEVREIPI